MAALYGRMQGNRGEVTRMGHADITAKLETWHGAVRTVLHKNGDYEVFIGSKQRPDTLIARGNVDGDGSGPEPEGRYAEDCHGREIVTWR